MVSGCSESRQEVLVSSGPHPVPRSRASIHATRMALRVEQVLSAGAGLLLALLLLLVLVTVGLR